MTHVKKLNQSGEKMLNSRLVSDLKLNLSIKTVQRHMQRCGCIYKKSKLQIILNDHHKAERMNIVGDWISENQDWSKTMFTDEKRFTLDGSDDLRTWAPKKGNIMRNKR